MDSSKGSEVPVSVYGQVTSERVRAPGKNARMLVTVLAVFGAVAAASLAVVTGILLRCLNSTSSCQTTSSTSPVSGTYPSTSPAMIPVGPGQNPSASPSGTSRLPPLPTAGSSVWPKPKSMTTASASSGRAFDPSSLTLKFGSTVKSERVQRAVDRLGSTFANIGCPETTAAVRTDIMVNLETGDEVAIADASEGYSLSVPQEGPVTIVAQSVVGALRALESLSQLIVPNTALPREALAVGCSSLADAQGFVAGFKIPLTPITITDSPAHAHRGLMLDTSRHYFPVSAILRQVDGMAASKLNVLHWHIVDSQSFPVASIAVPELSAGAYSQLQMYSQADVAKVVGYAADRGIRVIPEFDVPGHSFAWGSALPGLVVCPNAVPYDQFCAEPPCGQLDITKDSTMDVVKRLFTEMSAWFPDSVFHSGGDEVNANCYTSDPGVSAYLRDTGKTVDRLVSDFAVAVHAHLTTLNKTSMNWEDIVLVHGAVVDGATTTMQAWRGPDSVKKLAALGLKVVNSDSSTYYLDCGAGQWLNAIVGTSWCDPFKSWQMIYMSDPAGGVTDAGQRPLVLGAEATLWTEQTDEMTVDGKVWPRAAALAEALWSFEDSTLKNLSEAGPRLSAFRERLLSYGIRASALQPEWCKNGGC